MTAEYCVSVCTLPPSKWAYVIHKHGNRVKRGPKGPRLCHISGWFDKRDTYTICWVWVLPPRSTMILFEREKSKGPSSSMTFVAYGFSTCIPLITSRPFTPLRQVKRWGLKACAVAADVFREPCDSENNPVGIAFDHSITLRIWHAFCKAFPFFSFFWLTLYIHKTVSVITFIDTRVTH